MARPSYLDMLLMTGSQPAMRDKLTGRCVMLLLSAFHWDKDDGYPSTLQDSAALAQRW
jgi:hypothetical protein